jgi:NADPH:quinone reductase-like Zn-dependent oxidoreductase
VQVSAAGITLGELTWEETWTRDGRDRTPIIPAHEFSGIVVDAGQATNDFRNGDEVFGMIPFDWDGAAAELARAPVGSIARKPASLSHRDAAAIPISALTAWQALHDHAHVQTGERVLVLGATGSVGTLAVQLARQFGAHVTATTRRDDGDLLTQLGAQTVIRADGPAALPFATFDVVIDAVGGATTRDALDAVRTDGRLVALTAPPPTAASDGHPVHATFFIVTANSERLAALGEQVADGSLRIFVSDTYPLDRGGEAFTHASSPQRSFGKTIIAIQ